MAQTKVFTSVTPQGEYGPIFSVASNRLFTYTVSGTIDAGCSLVLQRSMDGYTWQSYRTWTAGTYTDSISVVNELAALFRFRAVVPTSFTLTSLTVSLDEAAMEPEGFQPADNELTVLATMTPARAAALAGSGSLGGVTSANDLTDLAVKPAVTCVATTNQTLSGLPIIDTFQTIAGSIILCTAQTAGAENGPWVAAAGAWTRPTWYASANTVQAFQFITTFVRVGFLYKGTTWRITSSGAVTIDTTATTWSQTRLAIEGVLRVRIDGQGGVPATGSKGFLEVPYNCTIIAATMIGDQSGSAVIDVKRSTYSGFPTTTSLCAAAKPTLSSAQKSQDTTLTGWTKTLVQGDILEFNLDSASTLYGVMLSLQVVRT